MTVIDLKITSRPGNTFPTPRQGKDCYVFRAARIYPSHELHAHEQLPSMRRSLSGQLQRQELFLSRSVSGHGLCPADLSGKSSGYRSLSEIAEQKALPHGHSRYGVPKHAGRSKRAARLAHIRRLCSSPDRQCQKAVYGRTNHPRSGTNGVCPGCDHHRSMPVHVSLVKSTGRTRTHCVWHRSPCRFHCSRLLYKRLFPRPADPSTNAPAPCLSCKPQNRYLP